MNNWKEFVKTHRYGLMGTVIFHLLLFICMVSVGISKEMRRVEMKVELDMPTPEEQELRRQEEIKRAEIRKLTTDAEVEQMLRSIAVNEAAVERRVGGDERERIEDYIREIEQELGDYGTRYQVRKDRHHQEDSLKYEEEKRRQVLDSLRSTVYVGESSVSYKLEGRYKTYLPIPVFKCEFGGRVVVTIVVSREGRVLAAEVVEHESKEDDCLREVAVDAALRSEFSVDERAPERQSGTITYNFVKQ